LDYKAFTDLFSSGCTPEQLNCGDGKCKHQYKNCEGDNSCGEDSNENNCCKYIFFAVFQEMVEGRSGDAFSLILNGELSHSICESSSRHAD